MFFVFNLLLFRFVQFSYETHFGLVFAKKHVITAACPDGEINLCASN